MYKLLLSTLIFFVLFLQSCTSSKQASIEQLAMWENNRAETLYKQPGDIPETLATSLFDDKDRTISEENIQRILNGRVVLPDSLRVAIYRYSATSEAYRGSYYWRDEAYLKTQQSYIDTLSNYLNSSKSVEKVLMMPNLMTPAAISLSRLREASVRLQADAVLVFWITSNVYQKYKLFNKDEIKAFATCEVLLLDNRTGVIPFSTIVTRDKLVKKDAADASIYETQQRAEQGAILNTLNEVGKQIKVFLNKK